VVRLLAAAPRPGLTEHGANPWRSRRCDRWRRPQSATAPSPSGVGRRGPRTTRKPEDGQADQTGGSSW